MNDTKISIINWFNQRACWESNTNSKKFHCLIQLLCYAPSSLNPLLGNLDNYFEQ